MNKFQEMFSKTTSSPYYSKMIKFAAPLKDHFGVNHFWYTKITNRGGYSCLGTHPEWNNYCAEHHLLEEPHPCLRHPNTQLTGIHLIKNTFDPGFKNVIKTAWEKYKINFNVQLSIKIPEGIETFGFATQNNHPMGDEVLLNELPLLRSFIQAFREENKQLFRIIEDNQVEMTPILGATFYKKPNHLKLAGDREQFLKRLGYDTGFSLSSREKEVLRFFVNGYPSSYIAEQLFLKKRTIENYIANIKDKLLCNTKSELIEKAQDLFTIGQLNVS